jgi:hypothetical protein
MGKTPSPPPADNPDTNTTSKPAPPTRKEIPLVSVPHDHDLLADEMAELFEEDQVTHKHGSSEPEGD